MKQRSGSEDQAYVHGWMAVEYAKQGIDHVEMRLYRRPEGGWLVRISLLTPAELSTKDPAPPGWRSGYLLNLAEIFRE